MSGKPFVIDAQTRMRQELASDPRRSAWVSANAGSGKTHVLSQRVIRLLLAGAEPSKILCLTYTKTAAAEMVNRVFERLAAWTVLDDKALEEAMQSIGETDVSKDRLKLARTLFARALETPGGLQIQTIHAFCTTILKRFPLESNIAGHFELMDDQLADLLQASAISQLKMEIHSGVDETLADAYELALDKAGEDALEKLFETILSGSQRQPILEFLEQREAGQITDEAMAAGLGLKKGLTRATFLEGFWPLQSIPEDMVLKIAANTVGKSKTINDFAENLVTAMLCGDPEKRFDLLKKIFLTDGEPRSPKNFTKALDDFADTFTAAANEIVAGLDVLTRLLLLDLSHAAHVLLKRLAGFYIGIKRQRGLLDYDDLIEATARLLQQDSAAAWVQYKLDQGIDHVLVDEAQDTNPRQWSIINTLTADFFAGQSTREKRTIFVVGDEKQSIYSFQGARPEVFGQTGREKRELATGAGAAFEPVTMPLSFRSTPEVLAAVDAVFGDDLARKGLTGDNADVIHEGRRKDEHGRVEVWDWLIGEKEEGDDDDWTRPVDHVKAPALQLARDIAGSIEAQVGKQHNPATGKIVEPGDILVLVRKRDKFMHALSRELKDRGIPVAGADRLKLTGHIAVQDLIAIARITLQPADDLALAGLLRSPVFGMSDDELTALATSRGKDQYLLDRIFERAEQGDARLQPIAEQLQTWRNEADFSPVHEFYARVLGRDGARAKLIARLGGEAADVIDEFMAYTLSAEKAGIHGLQGFIEALIRAEPEIKRELGGKRGEVRIMTVHGAKGLESKYVYLVDAGGPASATRYLPKLLALPVMSGNQAVDAFYWAAKAEFRNSATATATDEHLAMQEAEYRRQLYVGMTRAEDVLILCGFLAPKSATQQNRYTWNDMAATGLARLTGVERVETLANGRGALIYQPCLPAAKSAPETPARQILSESLPEWLVRRAAPAPILPKPLAPSGFGASIEDEPAPVTTSPVLGERQEKGPFLLRGSAVHRLLEVLPSLPREQQEERAKLYLQRRLGEGFESLAGHTVALLHDDNLAELFSGQSRAEVSIAGRVEFRGEIRHVSGKIDRLSVNGDRVLIADYKTTRPPPKDRKSVPPVHVAQLALYARLLKGIYPQARIGAALVYTEGPHVHAFEADELDAVLEAVTAL